jgi:selenide,water dikinase
MQKAGANACTDITGFGLLGHAFEMARASSVSMIIESTRIPLLPDVLDLIRQGMLTRGDKNNRTYVGDTVIIEDNISREMQSALFDPQTAGGLLISIDESKAEDLVKNIDGAVIIGKVQAKSDYLIHVI